jgi:hypothetical protein
MSGVDETARPDGLVLHADDDVAVLIRHVSAGESVQLSSPLGLVRLHLPAAVPTGHKVAIRALAVDHQVRKYGEIIGKITAPVAPGEHVHIHNLVSLRA